MCDETVEKSMVEEVAKSQVRMICDNEVSQGAKIRVMPDIHPGKVGPIGLTMTVGKKILATGNGKCNYTNLLMNPDCFHLKEGAAPLQVIEDFGPEDAIAFFQELGVEPFSRDGYIYPKSEQAVAIAQALEVGVRRWGGEIVTEVSIAKIKREKNGWNVIAQDRQWNVDRIIIATGLKASPTTGSDGSFLTLIEQMGYQVKSPLPALCALYAQEKNFFKKVAGVRIKCGLDVSVDQNIVASEYGELQLTDYGLSGIPIFQVSGRVARAIFEKKKVKIIVHFVENKSFLLERKCILWQMIRSQFQLSFLELRKHLT